MPNDRTAFNFLFMNNKMNDFSHSFHTHIINHFRLTRAWQVWYDKLEFFS